MAAASSMLTAGMLLMIVSGCNLVDTGNNRSDGGAGGISSSTVEFWDGRYIGTADVKNFNERGELVEEIDGLDVVLEIRFNNSGFLLSASLGHESSGGTTQKFGTYAMTSGGPNDSPILTSSKDTLAIQRERSGRIARIEMSKVVDEIDGTASRLEGGGDTYRARQSVSFEVDKTEEF